MSWKERWQWFHDHQHLVRAPRTPLQALTRSQYVSLLSSGLQYPFATLIMDTQLPQFLGPIALEWIRDLSAQQNTGVDVFEGVSLESTGDPPTVPVCPSASNVYALPYAPPPGTTGYGMVRYVQCACLFIEWWSLGVYQCQVVDAAQQGTFVIPCADRVRVSGMTVIQRVDADPNNWIYPVVEPYQCCIRPAELGERSRARVSLAPSQLTDDSGVTARVVMDMGYRVRNVQVTYGFPDANAANTGFIFQDWQLQTLYAAAWTQVSSFFDGVGPNVIWNAPLPPGTRYLTANPASTAAGGVGVLSVSADLG